MAMSPYYESDGVTLYHGDCRTVMPALEGIVADMVLADPPYGETSIEWDRWPDRWIASLQPVVHRNTNFWCFGSMRMVLDRRDEFAFWRFVQEIVWEKHNGSGFNVDRFRRVHEFALHFVPVVSDWSAVYKSPRFTNDATARVVRKKEKPAHWHGKTGSTTYTSVDGGPRMMRSVIHCRSMHGKALHPTQKPVGILEPLIEYSCPPGGLVLVPFAGCGSELEAAKSCGMRAIGIEANEEYCEITARRLGQRMMKFEDSPSP
jgi:site-specific DNA-methyltransferase (adenine-specific)